MNAVWVCVRCSALHHRGECVCRRCGAALPLSAGGELVPRVEDTEPVLLHLPPVDFPYSRAARPRGRVRAWVAPVVMVGLAAALAITWNPLVRRYDAARALGGESPAAVSARRAELGLAADDLVALVAEGEAGLAAPSPAGALPARWTERVEPLAQRYHLDGDAASATLGPLEVTMRAVWLELATLPPDAPVDELEARIQSTKEELSRVTSDLSHAR